MKQAIREQAQDIGLKAKALDEMSVWERMKVGQRTLRKIGLALSFYVITMGIMSVLL